MKRRTISVIIAVCIILSAFCTPSFAAETELTYHTVYLDTSASADGDGSASSPYNTLASAVSAIEAAEESAGIITVVGTLSVSANIPSHTKEITFTGADTASVFSYSANILIGGPTVFENIALKATAWLMIRTGGSPLTFGEGITRASGSNGLNIDAGANTDGKEIALTITSGPFNSVYVGSYGSADVTVNRTEVFVGENASVTTLTLGSDGTGGCTFTDDVFITVNGEVSYMVYTTKGPAPVFNGALTLLYNHGSYRLYDISETLSAEKGVYIMSCEKKDGSYLEITDTAGTFTVGGDNEAVAVSAADGAMSESSSKKLTVSNAGKYYVTYPDSDVEYLNGGSQIKVKADTTLDFAALAYMEPDGKLFVGWTDADGNPVSSGAFKAGDVLYAKYIDYSDTDFFIKDTQIRTVSDTADKQGLRFIIEKKLSFENALKAEVGGLSCGAVYMPTDYSGGTDMELESAHYVLKSVSYSPKKVVCENIYARSAEAEQYTLCITDTSSDLAKDKYYKFYTVKGYMEFTDINGVARVLYTDYLTTNLYKVALAEKEENPDSYSSVCNTIIEYVENERITEKTTGDGDYAFSSWMTGPESDSDYKEDYQATYLLNNGVRVRDIIIGTADDSEPINIVAFSDLHFNYYNKLDALLNNPAINGQWFGTGVPNNEIRGMGRVDQDFGSVDNANKLMEYGSFYDKTVIIGDIMDYFSYGCAELSKKLLVDRSVNNSTLIALGNHETAELFAKVTKNNGFREMFTQNYKYAKLNEGLWPHDIYYYSEVVTKGDKSVRIVVMDNQSGKYSELGDIKNRLEADIEDSKANNIPVLIFQHVPINTYNENYQGVLPYFSDGATDELRLYNETSNIGRASNAYTQSVYNLISANPDVVKGVFCGHVHNSYYTEISSYSYDGTTYTPVTDADGNQLTIPQYIVSGSYMKNKANALKISVY